MNKIYVDIDFTNGTLEKKGIDLITEDYASTEIEFTFDENHSAGTKTFEMKSPSGNLVYADEIVDNKVLLTAKDENENNVSLFDESGDYIFEVSLYVDNSKLTSVYGKLPVQKEQVEIEGEVVEKVLPLFEQLMQELDTAITQTNNLNITGSKSGTTTTITLTHKDGTTQTLQVLDGEKGDKGDKGDAGAIKMIIVNELPSTGQDDTIYLVPITGETGNNYDEYVYVNNQWEKLGGIQVEVDLTDYVKFTDYATSSKGGVIKTGPIYGTMMRNDGYIIAVNRTYEQYQNDYDGLIIGKKTLENVITGKGLVSNTNYATGSVAGVIKPSASFGTDVNASGVLFSSVVSSSNYSSLSNYAFISKGTLENVLTERIGDIQTLLDNLDTGSGV